MAGKQAKLLTSTQLKQCLAQTALSRHCARNQAMILLSAKAGLRACEISGLTWSMLLTADGSLGHTINLENRIAKKNSGRIIPMHPDLHTALLRLRSRQNSYADAVIRSERGAAMTASAVVNWFSTLYASLGLTGCSSHSGRRTFITNAARQVHKVGGSLRDVQILAGHRSITMTQSYIEGDTDAQRRLVRML